MEVFFDAMFVRQTWLTPKLVEVQIALEQALPFKEGQYHTLYVNGQAKGPYSIVSCRQDLPIVTYCLRHALPCAPGDKLQVGQALGQMTLDHAQGSEVILCAGGTGITPFISLMRSRTAEKFILQLLWSVAHKEDLILLERYQLPQPAVIHFYEPDDKQDLMPYLKKILKKDALYYLAGPYAFVMAHGDWLISQGILPDQIASDMKKFV